MCIHRVVVIICVEVMTQNPTGGAHPSSTSRVHVFILSMSGFQGCLNFQTEFNSPGKLIGTKWNIDFDIQFFSADTLIEALCSHGLPLSYETAGIL